MMLLVAQLPILGGCAASGERCEDLCDVAREAYESCQEEWGLSYGDPGAYESREDYENWCRTWTSERRLLAEHSEDPGAIDELNERCAEQEDQLLEHDCSTYHATLAD